MQKKKILIASIINFIALFLPYASMDFNYNYFLWKNNKSSELVADWFCFAADTVNIINAIIIVVLSIMLIALSVIYLKKENQKIEKMIKFVTLASICSNIFLCYHIYQLGEHRFMNIGVILAIASCVYIVKKICNFDKSTLLIIGAALVVSFPSIVQVYSETIEAPIEAHCHSFQTYFFILYSIFSSSKWVWLLAVPAMIVIFFTVRGVILTLVNNKKKAKAVQVMRIWYILIFVVEIVFLITSTEDTYLTLTYPIAIALVSIYLHLEKKKNKIQITTPNV